MAFTYFTYEKFYAEPISCISKRAANQPVVLRTVDIDKSIKVKDYKMQGIVNYNAKQISKLTQKKADAISEVLVTDLNLISFFGYEILNSGKLTRGYAPDLNIAAVRDQ